MIKTIVKLFTFLEGLILLIGSILSIKTYDVSLPDISNQVLSNGIVTAYSVSFLFMGISIGIMLESILTISSRSWICHLLILALVVGIVVLGAYSLHQIENIKTTNAQNFYNSVDRAKIGSLVGIGLGIGFLITTFFIFLADITSPHTELKYFAPIQAMIVSLCIIASTVIEFYLYVNMKKSEKARTYFYISIIILVLAVIFMIISVLLMTLIKGNI